MGQNLVRYEGFIVLEMNPFTSPREVPPEPCRPKHWRFVAFLFGAVLGTIVRAVHGPSQLKPYLFVPDLVLSAFLTGGVAVLIETLWNRTQAQFARRELGERDPPAR